VQRERGERKSKEKVNGDGRKRSGLFRTKGIDGSGGLHEGTEGRW